MGSGQRRRRLLFFAVGIVGVTMFAAVGPAQDKKVEGFNGAAEISVNIDQRTTTDTFKSLVKLANGSDQIVLLLQHSPGTVLPQDWSGPARLFLSDGVVAIVADAGPHAIFKFPDTAMPPSLRIFAFQGYDVFGIARYGLSEPVTAEKIRDLTLHGGCSGTTIKPNAIGDFLPIPPIPVECDDGLICQSGGQGSDSCSAGSGCNVHCTAGYWSCCNAGTNNCRCCGGATK